MQIDLENYNIEEINAEVSSSFLIGPQGVQGPQGNGIENILGPTKAGINDLYAIVFTDGTVKEILIPNGRGISKIELIESNGLIDTYQIVYDDLNTFTFTIKNGEKGEKGDTGIQGVQGPQGEKGDTGDRGEAFTYEDFTAEQLEALRGPKGDKGNDGAQGEKGETGETGPANTLSIGTVKSGETAGAEITGEAPNQILNLTFPNNTTILYEKTSDFTNLTSIDLSESVKNFEYIEIFYLYNNYLYSKKVYVLDTYNYFSLIGTNCSSTEWYFDFLNLYFDTTNYDKIKVANAFRATIDGSQRIGASVHGFYITKVVGINIKE